MKIIEEIGIAQEDGQDFGNSQREQQLSSRSLVAATDGRADFRP